jgi:hypothetical protein
VGVPWNPKRRLPSWNLSSSSSWERRGVVRPYEREKPLSLPEEHSSQSERREAEDLTGGWWGIGSLAVTWAGEVLRDVEITRNPWSPQGEVSHDMAGSCVDEKELVLSVSLRA